MIAERRAGGLRGKALLAIGALAFAAAVLELGARLYLRYLASPDRFLKYASISQLESRADAQPRLSPHRYLGYAPTRGYSRGPNRHNALGFRGAEVSMPKPPAVYRIACLGGSTTYGDGVDDWRLTYPALLQDSLRAWGVSEVEVVNAGVPGYSSYESVINLEFRVLDLHPDLVFFYEAINDVYPRLVWPPSAYLGDNSGFLGDKWPFEGPSLLERSTLARAIMIKLHLILPQPTLSRALGPPAPTSYAVRFGEQRKNGTYPSGPFRQVSVRTMLDSNPPKYWERNLRTLIAVARANGIRPVLATLAYSAGFPWLSESPEYREAIAENNDVLRQVAREMAVPVVDLAKVIPGDPRYFTDGVHFTEDGNGVMAHLIGSFLIARRLVPRTRADRRPP